MGALLAQVWLTGRVDSTESTITADDVRTRARAEMHRAILDAARRRLASDGATGLSLRAVARDVGMVSSAVYRYVPNRDALLTALIIESYDALGAAAEEAERGADRDDIPGRWRAIGRAAREWALAHPQEWALVYGSPVPGYAAPEDTIAAASRIPVLLVALLRDARAAGLALPDAAVGRGLRRSMGPLLEFFDGAAPDETVLRGFMVWTYLLGSISTQLFGQRHNVITDDGAAGFFDAELDRLAGFLGLDSREP